MQRLKRLIKSVFKGAKMLIYLFSPSLKIRNFLITSFSSVIFFLHVLLFVRYRFCTHLFQFLAEKFKDNYFVICEKKMQNTIYLLNTFRGIETCFQDALCIVFCTLDEAYCV
jgi:hypothetical protein